MKNAVFTFILSVLLLALLPGCQYIDSDEKIETLNIFLPGNHFDLERDIAYGSQPYEKLDYYHANKPKENAPLTVWIYGGGWNSGDKNQYEFAGDLFASLGHNVAIPNYSLYPDTVFPAFLQDNAKAIAFLVNGNYGAENGIIIAGHSAGAYNAAMMALDSRWLEAEGIDPTIIKGFIGLAGPYDFHPYDVGETLNSFGHNQDATDTQPIHRIGDYAPPALMIHGINDEKVFVRNSRTLTKLLREKGYDVTLIEDEELTHISILTALSRILRNETVTDPIKQFLQELEGESP